MTQMDDMVPMYKREVAAPGAFDTTWPGVDDAAIKGYLADGFAEAQLEGFFGTVVLDVEDFIPDLSQPGMMLIVIYAGMRTLRAQLLNANSSTRYKAGPTEYEVSGPAASVLTELIKGARARRDMLLEQARRGIGPTDYFLDYYALRVSSYGLFFPYELASGGYGG